jgi:N-acetylglucosaminyldiphosphoundecaprenol N-acetyl-beta-D-mannosaminyltransferase
MQGGIVGMSPRSHTYEPVVQAFQPGTVPLNGVKRGSGSQKPIREASNESGDKNLVSVPVLGTRVAAISFADAIRWLSAAANDGRRAHVACANVYSVVMAHDRPEYASCLNGANLIIADGMPIVWALRILGHPAERVHGDDLLLAFCRTFPTIRHFFMGGAPGQPEAVAESLRAMIPGICIAGTQPTPVRPLPEAASRQAVAKILDSGAEIVWVGMGTPAQDLWMGAAEGISAPMVGVGSAFDLLSGRTRATPEWIKRTGTQWLFRLAQEPRRLWRRYLTYNPRFVAMLARQVVDERLLGRSE